MEKLADKLPELAYGSFESLMKKQAGKLPELKHGSFYIGQRVRVKDDAGFARGAYGFIVDMDVGHDEAGQLYVARVHVRRDRAGESDRTCFHPSELEDATGTGPGPELVSPSVQDTLNERGKTHGDFSLQASFAQALKNLLRSYDSEWEKLSRPQREALETICMKVSRIMHGNPNEPDHWRDIAGYATLVENILVHGKSHLR
jgi:hypothetical protein